MVPDFLAEAGPMACLDAPPKAARARQSGSRLSRAVMHRNQASVVEIGSRAIARIEIGSQNLSHRH
jgi:hypothetical protein